MHPTADLFEVLQDAILELDVASLPTSQEGRTELLEIARLFSRLCDGREALSEEALRGDTSLLPHGGR